MVNASYDLWPRQHEHIVIALQVARMAPEAITTEIGLRQPVPLDHRPHRAVEDEDPLCEQGA